MFVDRMCVSFIAPNEYEDSGTSVISKEHLESQRMLDGKMKMTPLEKHLSQQVV